MKSTFSCIIIGETTLPIQCAELLQQRGHQIFGILSPDPHVLQWASSQLVPAQNPLQTPVDQLFGFIQRDPVDYLFSIVNYTILPQVMSDLPGWVARSHTANTSPMTFAGPLYQALINTPRKAAINYHDGPLPRYAGFYVTSWALINGENEHGVTWHRMTDQIDGGEIFLQKKIPIVPQDTALALNTRCYEAAIRSFGELADQLAEEKIELGRQDMRQRTYFDLLRRPPAGAILDWHKPAGQLDALVRALTFSHSTQAQPNPLGLPKIAIQDEYFSVGQLDIQPETHTAQAGDLLGFTDHHLTIAAADRPVRLSNLRSLDGQPQHIPALIDRFGLRPGERLSPPTPKHMRRLEELITALARSESWWVHKLETCRPISLPLTLTKNIPPSPVSPLVALDITAQVQPDIADFLLQHPSLNAPDLVATAFLVYLTRLTNGYTFDLGYTHCETQQQLDGLQNYFNIAPPLRFEVPSEATFLQALAAFQKEARLNRRHGAYSHEVLSRYPALQNRPELPGRTRWAASILHINQEDSKQQTADTAISYAAFTLCITTGKDGCAYQWLYDAQVLTDAVIDEMLDQFKTLLHEAMIAPQTPLWKLPLLSAGAQEHILVEWNQTHFPHPSDALLHRLFEAQVVRTPQSIAVIDEQTSLTYRQLDRQANAIAQQLIRSGIEPDDLVGVCLERSTGMVAALLGILKAGAAYAPLDPAYPIDRLSYMLKASQARVLITQRELPAILGSNGNVIYLEQDGSIQSSGQQSATEENPAIVDNIVTSPQNLAYVLFTSGSTGLPKGAMIHHAAICNHMFWMQRVFPLDAHDAVLQKTPFSFDASVWEFYAPLLVGSRLVMARSGGHADPAYLVKTIQQYNITTLQVVPTLLKMLLLEPEFANCTSLERVFVGGEALTVELADQFQAALPSRLINLYGPTEVTIDSMYWQFDQSDAALQVGQMNTPIGQPVDNIRAYILDPHMQPLPPGIPGELYLSGAGVGRGYLSRPDLTAERFLPDPFSNRGDRLYRTGDLVYWQHGKIVFLGRLDYQIKLRGFRIELGEIEAQIRQIKDIKDTVVLAYELSPGRLQLVAYLVANIKAANDRDENQIIHNVHSSLVDKLPDYMIPSAFVVLEAMPLTPNGKLDRKALPQPAQFSRQAAEAAIAPRTPTEEVVSQIWQQVLGVNMLGVRDDFFALGGNSLLATQVISRIRQTFEIPCSLDKVFELPTIEQIALWIEDMILAEIEALDDSQISDLPVDDSSTAGRGNHV